MRQQKGYLLGLGSNINPQQNTEKMVIALLQEFKALKLSRVLKIPPVGMNSHRDFLNTIVFVETDLSQRELKSFCNQIEINLGRDRDDPQTGEHHVRPRSVGTVKARQAWADSMPTIGGRCGPHRAPGRARVGAGRDRLQVPRMRMGRRS